MYGDLEEGMASKVQCRAAATLATAEAEEDEDVEADEDDGEDEDGEVDSCPCRVTFTVASCLLVTPWNISALPLVFPLQLRCDLSSFCLTAMLRLSTG